MEEKAEKVKDRAADIMDNVADFGKKLLNRDGAKKFAAWYIDTSEKLANGVLDYQERATEWAKSTALEPIFDAQNDLSRKFVKRSAEVARNLWQLSD